MITFETCLILKSLIEVCEEISYARIKSDKLVRLIEFEPGRAILVLLLPLDEYSDKKSKRLKKRLEEENIKIEDIEIIYLTHYHPDHIH